MTPSIGRVVHYVSYGTPGGEYPSVCRAAIITEIPDLNLGVDPAAMRAEDRELLPDWLVGLCVLNPTGMFFNEAEYSEDHAPGSWHWPERVPEGGPGE